MIAEELRCLKALNHTSHPELDELLKKSAGHKVTAGEIWDQRVSWAYGNRDVWSEAVR